MGPVQEHVEHDAVVDLIRREPTDHEYAVAIVAAFAYESNGGIELPVSEWALRALDAAEASKLATFLEPKVVIPMHWSGMGSEKALDTFLKEEGGQAETMDKLTIKKKDVADKDGAIMVITP